MTSNQPLLATLTEAQRQAVCTTEGPLLVLAGPGSGKTRTVTHRIARLVDSGVPPSSIVAITFTNKAAREMADRVQDLVGTAPVWVTTFHKFCARLIRQHAPFVGLQSNYTILDVPDQKRLMKEIMASLDIDATHYTPDRVLAQISTAKNDVVSPEEFARRFHQSVGDHFQAVVAKAFPAYQRALLASNAVDFDDLLTHATTLLRENDELRHTLGQRFRYLLVDEYQDTNSAQYQVVSAIAAEHRNLCVTGDPDQSIYGWRGARIANILNFERDFPEARVVRLEANFRSTKSILSTADRLIEHNTQRKPKVLTTENEEGTPVRFLRFDDGVAEADFIAASISEAVDGETARYRDFAILYRVNALSRELERALTRAKIPYQVAQGTAFYDRSEVKDVLAYLRLLANPSDRTAFQRVVNRPARRLGHTSQSRLIAWADDNGLSMLEAAAKSSDCPTLSKPARGGFCRFADLIDSISRSHDGSIAKLVRAIVDRTGYLKPHQSSEDEKAVDVVTNVEEVISSAADYDRRMKSDATLEGFLEESALVADTDALSETDITNGRVTLMTLHASKGLEYPHLFIVGVEQGLLPHERSLRENTVDDLEEERRLLFVGITRAEESLTLTHTAARATRGRVQISIQSQFLPEILAEHVDLTTQLAGSSEYLAHRSGKRWRDLGEQWEEPSVDINNDLKIIDQNNDDTTGSLASDASSPNDLFQEGETHGQSAEAKEQEAHDAKPNLKLTTGATLLTGSGQRIDLAARYSVGDAVRHPHYGVGEVTSLGEVNRRRKVTVAFGEVEETFIVGLSPLERIDTD